jgi:outer membrane protein assembly factor BamB
VIQSFGSGSKPAGFSRREKGFSFSEKNPRNYAVLVASNNTLFGLGPTGTKKWEYPSVDPLAEATYFNGAIAVYTSRTRMSALDAVTGRTLWQYAGSSRPYVFLSGGHFFIVDENGVKEHAMGNRSDTVTEKDTLTELARVCQAKGDLEQAQGFLKKASEIDANYPPIVLVRSRLLKAQGQREAAGKELARYAGLVGLDSKDGQQAVSEMKRDYGLLWESAISPDVAGDPMLIENRLVSVGRRVAHESAIVALDPVTGATVWQYTGERYVASLAVPPFLWYASSAQPDGTLVNLYRIDVRSGERKLVESRHSRSRVDQAWIVNDSGGVRVVTEPPLETGVSAAPPRAALWATSAYLIQDNRLYAYTPDGHAYAMLLR